MAPKNNKQDHNSRGLEDVPAHILNVNTAIAPDFGGTVATESRLSGCTRVRSVASNWHALLAACCLHAFCAI